MTGPQLVALLDAAGITQTDLARRLFIEPRSVRYWIENGVPKGRIETVKGAVMQPSHLHLPRQDRMAIAQLLDILAGNPKAASERLRRMAREYGVKLRASVGVLTR